MNEDKLATEYACRGIPGRKAAWEEGKWDATYYCLDCLAAYRGVSLQTAFNCFLKHNDPRRVPCSALSLIARV